MATAEHLFDENGEVRMKYFRKNGVLFQGLSGRTDDEMINILNSLDDFKARSDDVWICAFTKSGTHWVWEIVSMLLRRTTELVSEVKQIGYLEMQGATAVEKLESPRILNTHSPAHCMPQDVFKRDSKIICIMRNPKDVEVSMYYMLKKTAGQEKTTFEDHVKRRLVRSKDCGGWFDNVLGWYTTHKNNPNVLFVKYEDIQKDHLKHIKMIAAFLNQPEDEALFRTILEKTSFQNMQSNKTDPFKMYRKGKVGDWKNHFTVAMNEEYDKEYAERMKDADLTFDFEI